MDEGEAALAKSRCTMRRRIFPSLVATVSLVLTTWAFASSVPLSPPALPGHAPLAFVENTGQLAGPARYYAQGEGCSVYFEPAAVVLDRAPTTPGGSGVVVRVDFPAAEATLRLSASEPQASRVNVLEGAEQSRWRSGLSRFGEVSYRGVAPGADLVYRLVDGRLKYDVVLAPGADLGGVRLRYQGVEGLEIDRAGALRVHTGAGVLEEERPSLYQECDGKRVAV